MRYVLIYSGWRVENTDVRAVQLLAYGLCTVHREWVIFAVEPGKHIDWEAEPYAEWKVGQPIPIPEF